MPSTNSTYVFTKNDRSTTRQDRSRDRDTFEILLNHLKTDKAFRKLMQENQAYKDVCTILHMWAKRDIDIIEAHDMITAYNVNKYMPNAPTTVFEIAQALFNPDVRNEIDLVIKYYPEEKYCVEIVTTHVPTDGTPENVENTESNFTEEPDVPPTNLESILAASDVLTPDTHEPEMEFTKIAGSDKHSTKMKKVQTPELRTTPTKNIFDKLSGTYDNEEDLDDDEPAPLINGDSDTDSSVSMIFTQPEIPTRGNRGKISKTPTKKHVPDKDLVLITQMIAEGRAEELSIEEVAYGIEQKLDSVVESMTKELKGMKNNAKREIKEIHNQRKTAMEQMDKDLIENHSQVITESMNETTSEIEQRMQLFRTENANITKTYKNMKALHDVLRGSVLEMKNDYVNDIKDEIEKRIRNGDTFVHKDTFEHYSKRIKSTIDKLQPEDEDIFRQTYKDFRDEILDHIRVFQTNIEKMKDSPAPETSKTSSTGKTRKFDSRMTSLEEKTTSIFQKLDTHAEKFEKQQKELDKITKIDLRNVQETIKKSDKYVLKSDFDYLKEQFDHMKKELKTLQTPKETSHESDKQPKQEIPSRPSMQSQQQSPLQSKYTVILDGDTLTNGTKVRYRSPIMAKSQSCYIMETLDDNHGQRCYSAMTNTNTKIIIYEKHIESIEQRPENDVRQTTMPQSNRYRNDDYDNHSYNSYQPPYLQRHEGQRRHQTYRENDYVLKTGDYESIKRVDEQALTSLTTISDDYDLECLSKTNAEEFYTKLRLFLTRYGIPLKDWHAIGIFAHDRWHWLLT